MSLEGKRVTLCVGGSIAAYKAAVVARLLVKSGARVRTLLTGGGARFVGAPTFAGITGLPVLADMFEPGAGGELHVDVARESDVLVVVPATADLLARMAAGRADDLVAATILCARCPVLAAPAMHPAMWAHPATRRNVALLASDGHVALLGPVTGEVASGEQGMGRMMEPEDIVRAVERALAGGRGRAKALGRVRGAVDAEPGARQGAEGSDFSGRHVVVTAGPTVEDIDPVRFLTNRSSGKMGFALAACGALRGARVTLVAGPVSLETPPGVDRIDVRSALEMQRALDRVLGAKLSGADALVMSAAVGDFRAARPAKAKVPRGDAGLVLELASNPDVLAAIGARRKGKKPVLVGFAVETGSDAAIARRARQKLAAKRVDFIVANHASDSLGKDDNRATIVDAKRATPLARMPKAELADRILDRVVEKLASTSPASPKRRRRGRR